MVNKSLIGTEYIYNLLTNKTLQIQKGHIYISEYNYYVKRIENDTGDIISDITHDVYNLDGKLIFTGDEEMHYLKSEY